MTPPAAPPPKLVLRPATAPVPMVPEPDPVADEHVEPVVVEPPEAASPSIVDEIWDDLFVDETADPDEPARVPVAIVELPEIGDPGGDDPAGAPARRSRSRRRNTIEWVVLIVGALLVAFVVRTFVFQTFWIPSESMEATLENGDRVVVNKLSYRAHDVNRGDVVVFERPPTADTGEIEDLIKRVVGLPGERVSIVDGEVRIDGRLLTEPYLADGQATTYAGPCGRGEVTGIDTPEGMVVPEGTVFVLGDNRDHSQDGRCFGPFDQDLIVGRAFVIIWPPSKAGGL